MAKVKAKSKSKTKLKIKKDDDVIVISGRDRGKRGKVLRVLPAKKRVLVQGVAMARRHVKPTQTDPQGGIVEREATIHLSNVALVDPRSDLPTRAGYMVLEDGRKVRFAKRSGEVIDV